MTKGQLEELIPILQRNAVVIEGLKQLLIETEKMRENLGFD